MPTTEAGTVLKRCTGNTGTAAGITDAFARYGDKVKPDVIVRVVRRCRRELDIISGPALPDC
jgi:hypothetical protein